MGACGREIPAEGNDTSEGLAGPGVWATTNKRNKSNVITGTGNLVFFECFSAFLCFSGVFLFFCFSVFCFLFLAQITRLTRESGPDAGVVHSVRVWSDTRQARTGFDGVPAKWQSPGEGDRKCGEEHDDLLETRVRGSSEDESCV